MDLSRKWPSRLWIARHGESAGNVARDRAQAERARAIEYATRDADVPLSPRGERQAEALGQWLASLPDDDRPNVFLCSPYARARETLERALQAGALDAAEVVFDERLREREFGIFDGLTRLGVEHHHPEQARALTAIGKFYHRPPGGESWCDVILRLRSVVDTMTREYREQRVLVMGHQVIVLCFRYLLEKMSEAEILAIDRQGDVANCALTEYRYEPGPLGGSLVLQRYNHVEPLIEACEAVTTRPDVPAAPR